MTTPTKKVQEVYKTETRLFASMEEIANGRVTLHIPERIRSTRLTHVSRINERGFSEDVLCTLPAYFISGYGYFAIEPELCYEDELPEMTDEEYSQWFEKSSVIDGVRMGPKVK